MKVLLVSPYSKRKVGGIGTWSKSVLDYVSSDDDVNLKFQNTKSFVKKFAPKKESKLSRLIFSSLDTVSIITKLFFNLLCFRPDVVHFTSSASLALHKDKVAIFLTKKIFRRKIVLHWHFGRMPQICDTKGWEYNMLMKVVNASDASIVIDYSSYTALKAEGIEKVYYVPNPITKAINDAAVSVNPLEIASNRESGTILFVGHLLKDKGLFELVEACTQIKEVSKLVVVGFGAPGIQYELMSIAKTRDNGEWLEFTGDLKREDVFEHYKKCSVFCLPSYTEGFPYVVLEAMSFGAPIVATSVGAIPEMLSEDCGVVIGIKSVEQIVNVVSDLLANKEKATAMGNNAHNKVFGNFTIDIVYQKYKNVWIKANC